jgi:hypothetical protein
MMKAPRRRISATSEPRAIASLVSLLPNAGYLRPVRSPSAGNAPSSTFATSFGTGNCEPFGGKESFCGSPRTRSERSKMLSPSEVDFASPTLLRCGRSHSPATAHYARQTELRSRFKSSMPSFCSMPRMRALAEARARFARSAPSVASEAHSLSPPQDIRVKSIPPPLVI